MMGKESPNVISKKHQSSFTRTMALGIVGAMLFLAGCAAYQPAPKRPTSVNEWMGSTKQIVPAQADSTENSR
jgi:hypothetical protein